MTKVVTALAGVVAAGCCMLLLAGCTERGPLMAFRPAGRNEAGNRAGEAPRFSATADSLRLFGERLDATSIPFVAQAALAVRQHTFPQEGADHDPDVDPSASRIVFSSTRHSRNPHLYLQSVDGVAVTQLTSGRSADIQPCFSPDGRRVAFASDRSGNWDIWVTGIDDRTPIQITDSQDSELHPSWSPGGDRLAYCRHNHTTGQWELWIADLDKAAGNRFIGDGLYPDFSPLGDAIVYQRSREQGSRWFSVWRMDVRDGEPGLPTEIAASKTHALIQPAWSPDGRLIAYCKVSPAAPPGEQTHRQAVPVNAASEIWMIDADDQAPVQLTHDGQRNYGPAWGNDGRIYYTAARSGTEAVWSLRPVTGPAANADNSPLAASTARTPPKPQ